MATHYESYDWQGNLIRRHRYASTALDESARPKHAGKAYKVEDDGTMHEIKLGTTADIAEGRLAITRIIDPAGNHRVLADGIVASRMRDGHDEITRKAPDGHYHSYSHVLYCE